MPHQTSQSCLKELVKTADRILLMQGPVGLFFQDLSNWLTQSHGKTVYRTAQMSWHPAEWAELSAWYRLFSGARKVLN